MPVFKFNLEDSDPEIVESGGTAKIATADTFPALAGQGLALFSLRIKQGSLRIPHWHPDATEFNYCLKGKGNIGIIGPGPNNLHQIIEINEGDVALIPQGWLHWIQNTGEGDFHLLVIFNNDKPDDIGIAEGFRNIPDAILGETFSVKSSLFEKLDDEVNYLIDPATKNERTTTISPSLGASVASDDFLSLFRHL